jgi:nitrate/TMAO reductase-like tetraheme cytochrome c subunit
VTQLGLHRLGVNLFENLGFDLAMRIAVKFFFSIAVGLLLAASNAAAQISGVVLEQGSGLPIAGAEVRIQASLSSPVAVTNAMGQFTLNVTPSGSVNIAAAKAYDHATGAKNFGSSVFEDITAPATGVIIDLAPLQPAVLAGYQPDTASTCGGCHARYRNDWNTSNHANAANNVWVKDLFSGDGTPGGAAGYVFKNSHDPGESGFCATCHAPLQDVFTPGALQFDAISTPAGRDGVTCMACHQLANVNASQINGLHHVSKSSYYFASNTSLQVFGALGDVGNAPMFNVYNPLFERPLLCASCHQYSNPKTNAPGQSTYTEWLASPYAQAGANFRTCQDCHMPNEAAAGTIASTSGVIRPADQRHRHTFIGATANTLPQAITLDFSSQTQGQELAVSVTVRNAGAGHAFPTGVSIRNAVLVISAKTRSGVALQRLSGPVVPAWANDDVPGVQSGDFAGLPGRGYAKILEGRINGQGPVVRPVLFIDAEAVAEDSTIAAGAEDVSNYRFALPAGVTSAQVDVEARLLYRRAFRALAVTKNWSITPRGTAVEVLVNRGCKSGTNGLCDSVFADGFE